MTQALADRVQGQLAAVVAGFGTVFLPCMLAEGVPGLERRPLGPPLAREAWLLVHRDRKDVPRVCAMMEQVVTVFEVERERLEG